MSPKSFPNLTDLSVSMLQTSLARYVETHHLIYDKSLQQENYNNVSHLDLDQMTKSASEDVNLGSIPAPLVKGKSMPSLK